MGRHGQVPARAAVGRGASHELSHVLLHLLSRQRQGLAEPITPPTNRRGFGELAAQADKLGVELCLSFNPGIWSKPPLTYAAEDDYQLAWNKVKTVHALGVHSFALCLDDINTRLQPADAGALQDAPGRAGLLRQPPVE